MAWLCSACRWGMHAGRQLQGAGRCAAPLKGSTYGGALHAGPQVAHPAARCTGAGGRDYWAGRQSRWGGCGQEESRVMVASHPPALHERSRTATQMGAAQLPGRS